VWLDPGPRPRPIGRSGDRIAIASYLGGSDRIDQAIASFARAYAEQNDLDHRALVEAIANGRMELSPASEPTSLER
jgi:hypothetical protein